MWLGGCLKRFKTSGVQSHDMGKSHIVKDIIKINALRFAVNLILIGALMGSHFAIPIHIQ